MTSEENKKTMNFAQPSIHTVDTLYLPSHLDVAEETFAHLLNECPCFNTYRQDLLQNKPIINTLKWKATTLIQFSRIEAIDEALTAHETYIDI